MGARGKVGRRGDGKVAKLLRFTCPQGWSDHDRAVWQRMLVLVQARGVAADADAEAFNLLAKTQARYEMLDAEVAQHGAADKKGKWTPAAKMLASTETSLRTMLNQFGLTPQSRQRAETARLRDLTMCRNFTVLCD